jgi:hypothetical protein
VVTQSMIEVGGVPCTRAEVDALALRLAEQLELLRVGLRVKTDESVTELANRAGWTMPRSQARTAERFAQEAWAGVDDALATLIRRLEMVPTAYRHGNGPVEW